jgi:hypothetical protein
MKLLLEELLANFSLDKRIRCGYRNPKPTIALRRTNTIAAPTEGVWTPG